MAFIAEGETAIRPPSHPDCRRETAAESDLCTKAFVKKSLFEERVVRGRNELRRSVGALICASWPAVALPEGVDNLEARGDLPKRGRGETDCRCLERCLNRQFCKDSQALQDKLGCCRCDRESVELRRTDGG